MKRSQPMRRTPLRSRRAAPRRKDPAFEGHGAPWQQVRAAVYARSRGFCEACGGDVAGGFEAHHRLTRRLGPDCPCNVLALCPACHHAGVHGHPERSLEQGRILSRHSTAAPSTVPVLVHGRGWVRLTCDGNYAT